jgi:hypothetical protein
MLLTQIITHAMDHRSQISTTLSAHGITVPETSVWAWRKGEDGKDVLDMARDVQLPSRVGKLVIE